MTMRAIVRNSPDWALKILARDPERFFLAIDFLLSPVELGLLREGSLHVRGPHAEADRRLERAEIERPESREDITMLRHLLEDYDDHVRRSRPTIMSRTRAACGSLWNRVARAGRPRPA